MPFRANTDSSKVCLFLLPLNTKVFHLSLFVTKADELACYGSSSSLIVDSWILDIGRCLYSLLTVQSDGGVMN